MYDRIRTFLTTTRPETPCLVVDLEIVRNAYRTLRHWLPLAEVYYAVKANPAPEILRLLVEEGSAFDAASVQEIDLVLSAGGEPAQISYGNTIKKARDVARAYELGVRLFAFDSAAELDKLATHAPGASVFCRILVENEGADWPLSRKFGCSVEMAADLMVRARDLGLDPYGVTFHVGSQQRDLSQWDVAVGKAKMLFSTLSARGIELRAVNVGGGFPAQYRDEIPAVDACAHAVMTALTKHFGNNLPRLMIEPGRSLVGDAGVLQTEVVLVSRKGEDEHVRWVYLDVGRFGGLAETEGEAIKYRLTTSRDRVDVPVGPVVLAGPTCDSADILYEHTAYNLPLDLQAGDTMEVLSTGAYTASYSAVSFNGFPPLKTYFIDAA